MEVMFKVAGIAVACTFVEKVMDEYGHGDKTLYVRLGAWVAAAYVALEYWGDGVHWVARQFGVSVPAFF